jgi:hypothetical protein
MAFPGNGMIFFLFALYQDEATGEGVHCRGLPFAQFLGIV